MSQQTPVAPQAAIPLQIIQTPQLLPPSPPLSTTPANTPVPTTRPTPSPPAAPSGSAVQRPVPSPTPSGAANNPTPPAAAGSPPHNQNNGSRTSRIRKSIVRQCCNCDLQVAAAGLLVAVVFGVPAYLAFDLTKWTARKDYLEYCKENLDTVAAPADRAGCEAGLKKGLGPPPHVAMYFRKRHIRPIPVRSNIARGLLSPHERRPTHAHASLMGMIAPMIVNLGFFFATYAYLVYSYRLADSLNDSYARQRCTLPTNLRLRSTAFMDGLCKGRVVTSVCIICSVTSLVSYMAIHRYGWLFEIHKEAFSWYLEYCKELLAGGSPLPVCESIWDSYSIHDLRVGSMYLVLECIALLFAALIPSSPIVRFSKQRYELCREISRANLHVGERGRSKSRALDAATAAGNVASYSDEPVRCGSKVLGKPDQDLPERKHERLVDDPVESKLSPEILGIMAPQVVDKIPGSDAVSDIRQEAASSDNMANNAEQHELLNTLPSVAAACYDSRERDDVPTCLPYTRVSVLEMLCDWMVDERGPRIFWLNGRAGTGKSTIAQTLATEQSRQGALVASFFFSRDYEDQRHTGKFVTTIAKQLAEAGHERLRRAICDTIHQHCEIIDQGLGEKWRRLVIEPLNTLEPGPKIMVLLVIDALDQCEDADEIKALLQLLAKAHLSTALQLRVFVSSRPENAVRHGFEHLPSNDHQDLVLHDVAPHIVDGDIRTYLETNLKDIARERSLGEHWPGQQRITRLVLMSGQLFICAATVCRLVRKSDDPDWSLTGLDANFSRTSCLVRGPEKQLDGIYLTVLEQWEAFYPDERRGRQKMLKLLLGCIVTVVHPLPLRTTSKLLGVDSITAYTTLWRLQAIFSIPKSSLGPLRLHHPSIRDFLCDPTRSERFSVDEHEAHRTLAENSMQLIASLEPFCNGDPASSVDEVSQSRLEPFLRPEVQYACSYWLEHVRRGPNGLLISGKVHNFLHAHVLHWFEALGWMGKLSEGIESLRIFALHVHVSECPGLYRLIRDILRVVTDYQEIFEKFPLLIHSSGIPHALSTSENPKAV